MVSAARVVEEVSRERWAPVLKHLHQASSVQQHRKVPLHGCANADSVHHGLDHEVGIIE
jgi:hypothetical protein